MWWPLWGWLACGCRSGSEERLAAGWSVNRFSGTGHDRLKPPLQTMIRMSMVRLRSAVRRRAGRGFAFTRPVRFQPLSLLLHLLQPAGRRQPHGAGRPLRRLGRRPGRGRRLAQAAAGAATARDFVVQRWPVELFLRPDQKALSFYFTSYLLDADYAVLYANQWQRGLPSPELVNYFLAQKPAHIVRSGGLELARIYDVRNQPPPDVCPHRHDERR